MRISGPRALEIAHASTGKRFTARQARYCRFLDVNGDAIDAGIVLCFVGPNSYTGDDVVELQGHGGPVVLRLILDAVLARGARMARPGEFTERAFLNGKLDLAQAEAVADLIASASAAAARGAMRSLEGEFSAAVEAIDQSILGLRVFVEAAMDFPEEEVEFLAEGQVADGLTRISEALASLLRETRQGVLLRDGILMALIGLPNVGKSSLLNRLAGQERAIVSEIPGTTRDVVEADLVLEGLPIRVVDTAGLRDSVDPIEREGVRRARLQAARADLVLVLEDDCGAGPWSVSPLRAMLHDILPDIDSGRVIRVLNKIDRSGGPPGPRAHAGAPLSGDQLMEVGISAVTGAGIDTLVQLVKARTGYAGEGTAFTARRRHVEALRGAAAALGESRDLLEARAPAELVAEELRNAHLALGSIVGTVSADELLGEIFARFCIGK